MTKKPKSDVPPLKVIVEQGKLVPATAYDAERIDSYRNGTELNVTVSPAKVRADVIRWHAAIQRAVKLAKTPWPNADVASRSIKLALGLTEPYKNASGQWLHNPISLNDLDDPDLEEAVTRLYDLLFRLTGVDPAEWKKQARDIHDDPPPTQPADSGQNVPLRPEGDGGSPLPSAAIDPVSTEELLDDEIPDFEKPDKIDRERRLRDLRRECITKMLATAVDPDLTVPERRGILEWSKDLWKAELPPEHHDFLRTVLKEADRVAKGQIQRPEAMRYLSSLPFPKGEGDGS